MFKLFKPRRPPLDKIETVIGSNTSFNGHLKCDGNIRIDGLVEGGIIETVGNVVISSQGRVAARIMAEHVSVAGQMTGAIETRGYLEIIGKGRVEGDVRVANFHKDETAVLEGTLIMTTPETVAETPAAPSTESSKSTESPESTASA